MTVGDSRELRARAYLVGARIDTADLEERPRTRIGVVDRPGGVLFVFRFGAVVSVGAEPEALDDVRDVLAARVREPNAQPEQEEASILLDPAGEPVIDAEGRIHLADLALDRLAAVAAVLAKSVVLAHYEHDLLAAMERVEALAKRLRERRGVGVRSQDLLSEIGDSLLARSRMIGRAEIGEKHELTWELPEVDPLYERLAQEYELEERDLALDRKLALIDRTADVYLELIRARKSVRLEWYIVVLILAELLVLLYELFAMG